MRWTKAYKFSDYARFAATVQNIGWWMRFRLLFVKPYIGIDLAYPGSNVKSVKVTAKKLNGMTFIMKVEEINSREGTTE